MDKKIKSELAFVFSQLYDEHLVMVPAKILEEVESFDEEIFDSFDSDKPFTKQNLSKETLEILADIFKDKFKN